MAINMSNPFRVLLLTLLGLSVAFPQTFCQPSTKPKPGASARPPDWYNDPPSAPDTLIARGKGRSRDEQVAIDKAVADARSALARSINHRWQELLGAIEKEGGPHRAWTPEPVTLARSIPMIQKAVKRGATWTAYVLVGLPETSARNILHARLHRDTAWYGAVRNTQAVRTFETPSP
jgi:hypothetical protein